MKRRYVIEDNLDIITKEFSAWVVTKESWEEPYTDKPKQMLVASLRISINPFPGHGNSYLSSELFRSARPELYHPGEIDAAAEAIFELGKIAASYRKNHVNLPMPGAAAVVFEDENISKSEHVAHVNLFLLETGANELVSARTRKATLRLYTEDQMRKYAEDYQEARESGEQGEQECKTR